MMKVQTMERVIQTLVAALLLFAVIMGFLFLVSYLYTAA
jgi:hypothetical protein